MSNTRKSILTTIIGACAALALPSAATAAPVGYSFSADFNAAASSLSLFVPSSISGVYIYDDSTSDSNSSSAVGDYAGLEFSKVSGGSIGTALGNSGSMEIFNNNGSSGDKYQVTGPIGGTLSSGTSWSIQSFALTLLDSSGTALSSDGLPSSLPGLSSFPDLTDVTLSYLSTADNFTVSNASYDLTDLTRLSTSQTNSYLKEYEIGGGTGVPEPPAALLLATGLLAVGFAGRRRRRG